MDNRLALSLLLCGFLSGCGGSDPQALTDEGLDALHSGQYEEAAKKFDQALSIMGEDPSTPEWKRAKMGAVQARTRTDPTRAKDEFLALASAHPSKFTDLDFNVVGSRLGEAKAFDQAADVLKAGMKAHPESPHLKALLDQLGEKAEESGAEGALEKLKGLGYGGGD
jgi:hypothetical protein